MASTSQLRKTLKTGEFGVAERVIPRPSDQVAVRRHATSIDYTTLDIPKVALGEPVLWYSDCSRNSTPHNGFVAAIDTSSIAIDVVTANGFMRKPTVIHIDDPRKVHGGLRRFGGWAKTGLAQQIADQDEIIKQQGARIIQLQELLTVACDEIENITARLDSKPQAARPAVTRPAAKPVAKAPEEEVIEG